MAQRQRIKRIILTGAIAAITATGAWYGAGLKTRQEFKQEIQARRDATPAEKIAQLESARGSLLARRSGLERKIADLEARKSKETASNGERAASTGQERR
ncbi:MAG: hypothetical protein M1835_000372 [Candelina submexicana]|nr:MAG: hypothetical protein M1835_000372 [Candelina submexicana]